MTTNAEFFTYFEGLTFDDVVVVPGYSDVLPDAVNTDTVFARDIQLSVPLVSAAMDKVTESRLAIALARVGGLGIIHRNLTIEDQASEVRRCEPAQATFHPALCSTGNMTVWTPMRSRRVTQPALENTETSATPTPP